MRFRRLLRGLWIFALIALYVIDTYEARRRVRFWRRVMKEDGGRVHL